MSFLGNFRKAAAVAAFAISAAISIVSSAMADEQYFPL
jgi:NADH:ubiquinone oxidoreductase subunit H